MTRPLLRVPVGFSASAIDKVERLLELLAALRDDRVLADAFVLHGGTALNLFHDDAPRLSVDIDLLFVAEADVDAMRRARPEVDARIRRVIWQVISGACRNGERVPTTFNVLAVWASGLPHIRSVEVGGWAEWEGRGSSTSQRVP